jgi:hypothetical protein
MQKLTRIIPHTLCRQDGSALVGVLFLGIIMSIAGIGYLGMITSASRDESSALANTRVFLAAESGLLYASRWARTLDNVSFYQQNGATPGPITVNGYTVTSTVTFDNTDNKLVITGSVEDSLYQLRKTIVWRAGSSFGGFAHLYGKENIENDNTAIDLDWDGWGATNRFIGRFHMNDRIRLADNTSTAPDRYEWSGGLVTTSSGPYDKANSAMNYTKLWENAHPGLSLPQNENGWRNRFDEGIEIWKYSGADAQERLTNWFKDQYLGNQSAIVLPSNLNNTVSQTGRATIVTLPASGTPSGYTMGTGKNDYRPTIEYKQNKATYHYYNKTTKKFDRQDVNYDGAVLVASQDINVLGVVTGKTTLVTQDNKSIVVVADNGNANRGNNEHIVGLVYKDYAKSGTDYSIPTNNDVLAFVSGKDIVINHQWVKKWNQGNDGTIKIQDLLKSQDNALHVNAVFIATETSESAVHLDLTIPTSDYFKLYVTGANAISTYRSHAEYGNGTPNGNTYTWDQRLLRKIAFPNQPFVFNADGLLVLYYYDWNETNSAL